MAIGRVVPLLIVPPVILITNIIHKTKLILAPLPFLLLALTLGVIGIDVANAQPHSSETELGYIPIPRSLAGYRISSTPPPRIKVTEIKGTFGNSKSNPNLVISIVAPFAVEMKLSDEPTFTDVPWRSTTETIPWISRIKPNQDVYTIYAVFRYRNPANNRFEISAIVHHSVKVDAPYKKITRTSSGYFNWYDMRLVVRGQKTKASTETDFYTLQQEVESLNARVAYGQLEKIPLISDFTLKEFLYLNPEYMPLIADSLGNMKLLKAYYPTTESLLVEQELYLLRPPNLPPQRENALSIYQYASKNLFKRKPSPPYEDFGSELVENLIIDVRGMRASPAWFWKLTDDENNVIFTPAFHNSAEVPFIRYLRDLKGFAIPKNTLVVKATDVNRINHTLTILPFYGKILLNRPEQLERIANGNFYILTD